MTDKHPVRIKLPKTILEQISLKIKHICTFADYVESTILQNHQFFSDEVIVYAFRQAQFNNVKISDFIRFALGLIDYARPCEKEKEIFANRLVHYTQETKQELKARAKAHNLAVNNFIYIKLKVILETQNIFSEEELNALIKESNKNKQALIDLISNKFFKDKKCTQTA